MLKKHILIGIIVVVVSGFLKAQGGLPFVLEDNRFVALAWEKIPNATSYKIKKSISPTGPFETIGTLGNLTSLFYTDIDVENDQYYYYTITGVNTLGEGTASTVIRGMPALYVTHYPMSSTNGWGPVEIDQSNGESQAKDGTYITLNGQTYSRGLGVHANSEVKYTIGGSVFERFVSDIGIDDEVGSGGAVIFSVLVDNQEVFNSGIMTGDDPTQTVDVDLIGAHTLLLKVSKVDSDSAAVSLDHASWAGARFKARQRPYQNSAHEIPGKIEVEEYDLGGNNQAYYDKTKGSETGIYFRINEDVDLEICTDEGGGYNLVETLAGEWVEYTVKVAATGDYDLDVRVAKDDDAGTFHIEMDGVNITDAIAVPNTGGRQVWQTVTVPSVNLEEGERIMRIVFDSDFMNLNYVAFRDKVTGLGDFQSNDFEVYPNPFDSDGVIIRSDYKFSYTIVDIRGVEMETGLGNDRQQIGLSCPKGIYFLKIKNEKETKTQKIVRQ